MYWKPPKLETDFQSWSANKILDSPMEVQQMWEKVEKEKAAGGYPWTHLQHNCTEEVWINPLNLPGDISKYNINS